MIDFVLPEILEARPQHLMWISQRACYRLWSHGTYCYVAGGEIIWVGIIRVPHLREVYLRLLIEWKVDQWMSDAEHWSAKPVVKREKAFTLLNYPHRLKQVHRVLRLIVFLTHWPENFRLHPGAHHPEWVWYTVADDSTRRRSQGVKSKRPFL